MINPTTELGAEILRRMDACGDTVESLRLKMGYSHSSIAAFIHGAAPLSPGKLRALIKVYPDTDRSFWVGLSLIEIKRERQQDTKKPKGITEFGKVVAGELESRGYDLRIVPAQVRDCLYSETITKRMLNNLVAWVGVGRGRMDLQELIEQASAAGVME